ncbi:REPTOR-binding partner isoform X1 [Cherax quadricarinatus]|uniref:REPTOR-binding partner isoform X1 n=1 Tax=Cherax quadricarinatus TaxID=27406 RepID=UPI002378326A|nr:REPTOR-binding partner-like isoform X1 [Cherax quadricarinatus]
MECLQDGLVRSFLTATIHIVTVYAFVGSKREGTKRGRKPGRKSKSDMKAKLERSRQSARECRARKKLRYQYLEELVANREKAVFALHRELDQYRQWAKDIDEGKIPEGLLKLIEEEKIKKSENE